MDKTSTKQASARLQTEPDLKPAMSQTQAPAQDAAQFRYERKFVVPADDKHSIIELVRCLPGGFTCLYPMRRINNVYFDSPVMEDFTSTVNGEKHRQKVRLRWYGDRVQRDISGAQIEIKIKTDQSNRKRILSVPNGDSDNLPDWITKIKALESDANIVEAVKMRRPVLLNSYERYYFASADRSIRLTVDLAIAYQALDPFGVIISQPLPEEGRSILELKYDIDRQHLLPQITNAMAFRMSRNSKYKNGVMKLMEHGFI